MYFKTLPLWNSTLLLSIVLSVVCAEQPHIVFIMADDLGWNDVSFHGSDQILTPNIDALAYQGVILQQYYTEPICTPARSALLTGKYPMRLGMQGMPLYNSEDRGIPLNETLLPAYLKQLGYSTHLVGKWHVGMSRPEYLPTRRGYDSHYGIRGGFVDYYTYNIIEKWPNGRTMCGLDIFDDMKQLDQEEGYLTDLLTDRAIKVIESHDASRPLFLQLAHGAPHAGNAGANLQPPPRVSRSNYHIAYSDRRLYADVVQSLDRNIGRVVGALAEKGILNNTIIVFVSDNGAPSIGMYNNFGVNLPHRGTKHTPWEGAVRVPAVVYHSSLTPSVWDGLMHITDWLPTFVSAAGGKISKSSQIDGVNQWNGIVENSNSKRGEVLLTVDDVDNFAAYRLGDYKVIVGNLTNKNNGYYGGDWLAFKAPPPAYIPTVKSSEVARVMEKLGRPLNDETVMEMRNASMVKQKDPVTDKVLCEPSQTKGCLFNVRKDPLERHDLWNSASKLARRLVARLRTFWSARKPRTSTILYEIADPALNHFTWKPWLFENKIISNHNNTVVAWKADHAVNPFPKMAASTFVNVTCLRLISANPPISTDWSFISQNTPNRIIGQYNLDECIQYS